MPWRTRGSSRCIGTGTRRRSGRRTPAMAPTAARWPGVSCPTRRMWRSASAIPGCGPGTAYRPNGPGSCGLFWPKLPETSPLTGSGPGAAPGGVEEEFQQKELETAIHGFLSSLPRRDRGIFLRRYFFVEPVQDIAARYAMGENAVSAVLSRTRKKLRTHLEKEGWI